MILSEIFITLANLLVAAFVLNIAAMLLFALFTVMDWLRCHFHGIPFDSSSEEFYRFYMESFLPTMSVLFVTVMFLKFFLGAKGG